MDSGRVGYHHDMQSHETSPESSTWWLLRLEPGPEAPRRARDWLEHLGLPLDQTAVLLAHELVINSVTHSDAEHIWLTVVAVPAGVRIEVTDDGRGHPEAKRPGPLATSGRGLRWVDALADDWGVAPRQLTHVWFQVPLEGDVSGPAGSRST
jgi:serine/threonine-protein kinase RsbW